jgi:hypothetical protein
LLIISGEVKTGDKIEIAIAGLIIRDISTGKEYRFKPFGPVRDILEAGGLTAYNKRRLGLE